MVKMFWQNMAAYRIPFLFILYGKSIFSFQIHPHLNERGIINSTSSKLVFAHFMVGLTINYTRTDWSNQITLAAGHGIDAFVLNVGTPSDWQVNQVSTAYDLASQTRATSGQPFKMFLSLDMSVIQSASDVTTWVTQFLTRPSQLNVGGRPLLSTFAGEENKLGATNLSVGWQAAAKTPLLSMNPPVNPLFIPVWSSADPRSVVSSNPVVDGIMTWKSWPTASEVVDTSVDTQFQADSLKNNKLFMAGVSPCFFTHYSDKNYIFKSDDNLYITRWKELISMPTQPDFIEIISWNDYGESHYIGPIAGTHPSGTTWVDGFDHQAWLSMTDYFITWYKTGTPPTIAEDAVYFQYRPHSVSAVASDPLGPPANASVSNDAVYAATFLTPNSTASTLSIAVGGVSRTFNITQPGSVSTFIAPWSGSGGAVEVALLDKNGKTLLKKTGSQKIDNTIKLYNFNYVSDVMRKSGISGNAKKGSSVKNIKCFSQKLVLLIVMSFINLGLL
ncbi:glycosyl hydrolase family 71-domain-containing protein [Phakopsora pachyrhizi]|uniref:Glycosyl hydrolase family 71-domain-containing protein n=1 Tax=Phakopsora pachyrhizi TaxID=170000 RepID=A0AAV0BQK7_PHAPC|nr:glycosyl hydrolase family 71-domain-containing protein [Phakopsora pachyrhizi]